MMEFANPPPTLHIPPPNMSVPPPNMGMPPPPGHHHHHHQDHFQHHNHHHHQQHPHHHHHHHNNMNSNLTPVNRSQYFNRPFFRPFQNYGPRGPLGAMTLEDFDGKRLRKSVMRKTVDYNSAIIKTLESRVWQRDLRDRRALQPDVMYYPDLMPPPSYPDNPINCVTTRFVKTATNKMRCPIFCMAWTPEGRRLVTGASSGEFTLWNGLTFNFETILQAHDSPVRTMVWSHNDSWMVTGDHAGYIKYWQSNMNNVKMFQAHKEALRGISFSPSDSKFVTCSDDGTLRIWDFMRCCEERVLRGHGADVKCVHWHPQKGLIISGSKDNQQPIKLWDPKSGQSLATLHAHKSTVMDLKWNENGNWLITASRDHLLKLFDLRNLNQEVQTFRGHKKEASSVAWHPQHEGLFSSGGSDGSIMFWHVGADKEVGAIEQAHDSIVWTLAWHPLGHILCSGSNDHTSKFWTRNRPGDQMRDKYNLNTMPAGLAGAEDADVDEPSVIPGMGPEDKVEVEAPPEVTIPGLDLEAVSAVSGGGDAAAAAAAASKSKKVPYSKPIPRNFQAQWNETGEGDDASDAINEVITHIVENTPGVVPLQKIEPSAIIVYGKLLPVEPGSKLEAVIAEGPEALKKYIASGAIEELHDVMPHEDDTDYLNDDSNDDDDDASEDRKKEAAKDGQTNNASSGGDGDGGGGGGSTASSTASAAGGGGAGGNGSTTRRRKSRFSDITEADKDLKLPPLNLLASANKVPEIVEKKVKELEKRMMLDEERSRSRDMEYSTNSTSSSRFEDTTTTTAAATGATPASSDFSVSFRGKFEQRPIVWNSSSHQEANSPGGYDNNGFDAFGRNITPQQFAANMAAATGGGGGGGGGGGFRPAFSGGGAPPVPPPPPSGLQFRPEAWGAPRPRPWGGPAQGPPLGGPRPGMPWPANLPGRPPYAPPRPGSNPWGGPRGRY